MSSNSALDFEAASSYSLQITATDSSPARLSTTDQIQIELTNINEAPRVDNQTLTVSESAVVNTTIGRVLAIDPDAGQSLSYAIAGGSGANLFSVSNAGWVTLRATDGLDYESTGRYDLLVDVADNGSPRQTSRATVTIDVANSSEAPQLNPATFTISESAQPGTTIGRVTATADTQRVISGYTIISGNSAGLWSIDSAGAITLANNRRLDYEDLNSRPIVLTVQATDNSQPTLSRSAPVTIVVTDANDAPTFGLSQYTLTMRESDSSGKIVGSIVADDEDAGSTLTYTITGGSGQALFEVNSRSGAIVIRPGAVFNFESQDSYVLLMRATDDAGVAATTTVTIRVADANEPPQIASAAFAIEENSTANAVLGSVQASDADANQRLNYTITGGTGRPLFKIESNTGRVLLRGSGSLDFESVNSYTLVVSATDNGPGTLSSTATITVSVLDVNEAPTVSANQAWSIDENSPAGTIIGTVIARDADERDSLTYNLLPGTGSNLFSIHSQSGQLAVAAGANLDFESSRTYALTIQVRDRQGLTASSSVRIDLRNVNEAPQLLSRTFSVPENSNVGTVVGTSSAVLDNNRTAALYEIVEGNLGNLFAINSATGTLMVANKSRLNYEAITGHRLVLLVRATDSTVSPRLSTTAAHTIVITDVNEAPHIANQTFVVSENSPINTLVGRAAAVDEDALSTLSFAILSGNETGTFAINSVTGDLTIADNTRLDFEFKPVTPLIIRVMDGQNAVTNTITIDVRDLNEAPMASEQSFSVSENVTPGALVGQIRASDVDRGQTLSYSLLGGTGLDLFTVNSNGRVVVWTRCKLDFENSPPFYTLDVQISDNGQPALHTNVTIKVLLSNIDERPNVDDLQEFEIAESSDEGNRLVFYLLAKPRTNHCATRSWAEAVGTCSRLMR